MQRIVISLAAAALVAAAMPSSAQANCRGCAVGAGVIGGLAAGAIIGSAIANSQPRYAEPEVVYAPPPPTPAYDVEPPEYVDGPVCHTERTQFWDGYGYRTRRVQVCD
ncbi:MAG TPA: hypothetical protein VGC38_06705 [Pseudolabrys sp.]